MRYVRYLATLALCMVTLAACWVSEPTQMAMSFSAYTKRPVVVTEMSVNGTPMAMIPSVVRGKADQGGRRLIMGNMLLGYPAGSPGMMKLNLTWVELPFGAAYQAEVQVRLADLETRPQVGIDFTPIFGPGGLLIIASDPLPKANGERVTRDVVRLCATRKPSADVDYTANPRELPALFEALQAALTTPAETEC